MTPADAAVAVAKARQTDAAADPLIDAALSIADALIDGLRSDRVLLESERQRVAYRAAVARVEALIGAAEQFVAVGNSPPAVTVADLRAALAGTDA